MKVSWDHDFQKRNKNMFQTTNKYTMLACYLHPVLRCVWERNENCDKSDRLCHGGRKLGSAGHFHNSIVAIVVTSLVIIMINLVVEAIVMFNYPI